MNANEKRQSQTGDSSKRKKASNKQSDRESDLIEQSSLPAYFFKFFIANSKILITFVHYYSFAI